MGQLWSYEEFIKLTVKLVISGDDDDEDDVFQAHGSRSNVERSSG